MKLITTTLTALSLIACTCAQGIYINYPPAGATIHKNKKLTVQVVRPNHIISATEVGLVISMNACPGGTCPPAASQLGTILYNGPFNPQFHGSGQPTQQYQNFTIKVPDITGPADLIATRFFVIGAGPSPTIGGADNKVTVK